MAPGRLLEIQDLHIEFATDRGLVAAVNGVSLSLLEGQTLGLVGESGSGKSVTGSSILRLVPTPPGRVSAGRILFEGRDVLAMPATELRRLRGREIGMVFQDPLSALNPVMTVGEQVMEAIRVHEGCSKAYARRRALEVFQEVGLPDPEARLLAYPHQLSGGMRQRVVIAMAVALHPKLLIADEPTTALDVTVQAQIIALFRRLSKDRGLAVLLISHDLGVVVQLAERIAVMYAGHVVEEAPTRELFHAPRHPYTLGLLNAIPSRGGRLGGVPGSVPDPVALPTGCPFHPRCPNASVRCPTAFPEDTRESGRRFACYHPEPAGGVKT